MFFFGAEIAFANEIFIENGTERAEMYPKLILFFLKFLFSQESMINVVQTSILL